MSKLEKNKISLRVSCGICGTAFPKYSKKLVFSSLEEINIHIDDMCQSCKSQINQSYWIDKGADDELRVCIGNREDINHPITTVSGTITTNGALDPIKLQRWEKQGLLVIRND